MINTKNRISLSTQEHSLIDLHNRFLNLSEEHSPASRTLIEQLIDYYNKIILCMPSNVYWMDKDGKAIGCNQNVLDLLELPDQHSFYGLSFSEMSHLGR